MIFTFYSYKGGVGRSMALANVGEYLYSRGARVVLVDWDLEAPGLETFFFDDPKRLADVRSQLGLIDLLEDYKRRFLKARASVSDASDGVSPQVLTQLLPIETYLFPVHEPKPGAGALWLLPAGWRTTPTPSSAAPVGNADDRFSKYAALVQSFDWSDFYTRFEGEAFFDWFRTELLSSPGAADGADTTPVDAVLIDSRTGVTEVGGIATRQLADVVVCLTAPNYQNLAGVADMSRSFLHKDVLEARKQSNLEVVIIPARVDETGETTEQNKFRERFDALTTPPRTFAHLNIDPWDLLIPYVTKYAYAETLTVNAANTNQRLERAYKNLTTHLVLFTPGESRLRSVFATEIRSVSHAAVPRVYVLAAGSRDVSPIRERLAADLAIATSIDAASTLLLVMDDVEFSATKLAGAVRSEIRLARQKGVPVSLAATVPTSIRPDVLPRSLRNVPVHDLSRDWPQLIRHLRRPDSPIRVPFLAPALPAQLSAGRVAEVDAVIEALLSAGGRDTSVTVVIQSAPGMGASTLASRVCYDERVLEAFEDGVLWATLGEDPYLLSTLRHLYQALSRDPASFDSVEVGIARLAEQLAGRSCLLVVDAVFRPKDAEAFSSLPCRRLLTTRRSDVAPDAIRVPLRSLAVTDAIQFLRAGLAGAPDSTSALEHLAVQLGCWPAALARARAQLSRSTTADVLALSLALETRGANALGEAPDLQQSFDRYAASVMPQLTDLERGAYNQLLDLDPRVPASIGDVAALLRVGPDETRALFRRLGTLDLAVLWPSDGDVSLSVFAIAYLRGQLASANEARRRPSGDVGMGRACLIRPFGTRNDIDFDRVERELVVPALTAAGFSTTTVAAPIEGGNVRVDQLQTLLLADVVLADISVDDANVFYMLGVRHALARRHTVYLRASVGTAAFDLRSDRYLQYDGEHPGSKQMDLVHVLRLLTDTADRTDSVVLLSFPDLQPPERRQLTAVPPELLSQIEQASTSPGDLSLLTAEVAGFPWELAALLKIEQSQRRLRDTAASRIRLERVLQLDPGNIEATLRLGLLYRRLGELQASDAVLRRVVDGAAVTDVVRAETLTALGGNAKARWIAQWQEAEPAKRQEEALASGLLMDAIGFYENAFSANLHVYYAALNALALLTIAVDLASSPGQETWESIFDSKEEAAFRLNEARSRLERMKTGADLSLRAAERRPDADVWTQISRADWRFLVSKSARPVVNEYKKIVATDPFVIRTIRRQLEIFRDLSVLKELANEVLAVLPSDDDPPTAGPQQVVLFVGHMIDLPHRAEPRFPADKEPVARDAIKAAVLALANRASGRIVGVAAGSNGGDILFHEVCLELGVATEMYLSVPAERYVAAAVQSAGDHWVERFYRLYHQLQSHVLGDSFELPMWLRESPGYGVWRRNAQWMLHHALAAGDRLTLLALWNGAPSDGPGGVQDVVETARKRGADVQILDTTQLFRSP